MRLLRALAWFLAFGLGGFGLLLFAVSNDSVEGFCIPHVVRGDTLVASGACFRPGGRPAARPVYYGHLVALDAGRRCTAVVFVAEAAAPDDPRGAYYTRTGAAPPRAATSDEALRGLRRSLVRDEARLGADLARCEARFGRR